ncbi:MAG: hypothetical protein AAF389_08755 [Gemmatimonadota bacterium]
MTTTSLNPSASARCVSVRPLVLVMCFGALASDTHAQQVVMVHEEPRHRRVFTTDALRVLDVQIAPQDTTLFHTHDTPITYVTLGTSSTDQRLLGGEWNGTEPRDPPPGRIGAVRGVMGYVERPITHQVTNVGSTLFRLIAIANRGAGNPDAIRASPGEEVGPPNRWFRYSRLITEAGEHVAFRPATPTVAVLIRGGRVAFESEEGWRSSLESPGDVHVLEPGETMTVRDDGSSAEIVFVEVR